MSAPSQVQHDDSCLFVGSDHLQSGLISTGGGGGETPPLGMRIAFDFPSFSPALGVFHPELGLFLLPTNDGCERPLSDFHFSCLRFGCLAMEAA